MLFLIIPTLFFLFLIIISIIFSFIMYLQKIKYSIINIILLIFCFSTEFILAKFIYTYRGLSGGNEEIVVISNLEKYENIIGIIQLLIWILLFLNYIYTIIFSIKWIKNNKENK